MSPRRGICGVDAEVTSRKNYAYTIEPVLNMYSLWRRTCCEEPDMQSLPVLLQQE